MGKKNTVEISDFDDDFGTTSEDEFNLDDLYVFYDMIISYI